MKPSESKVKGPTGKGSLVKCKRSKSTSSDGEVHSVVTTHSIQQQQQLRPGLHPPHSTMVNDVSSVRFEQIDNPSSYVINNGSSSSGGSCATSSKFNSNSNTNTNSNLNYTPPPSTATVTTTTTTNINNGNPNTSSTMAAATPATTAATILASAFPHRTRHSSSLNSALRGFSLRRLFNPSSFGKSTTNQATTLTTSATTGPAGKVTSGSRNTISVDSHNSSLNEMNSSSNMVNKTSHKSNSLSCDNSSLASAKNSSTGGPYDVEAATASSSSTNNHGTSSKHSSIRSSFHSSIIPSSGRKSHSTIKTSISLGHQTNGHGHQGNVAGNCSTSSNGNGEVVNYQECPLCLLELPTNYYPQLRTCNHRACYDCLQQYLRIEISESRIMVTCPECTELIHPNDIRTILNDEIYMEKYEKFMLRRVLIAEADARWCPAPDCGYVVIAAGCAGCPKLQCKRPGCHTNFCYHCKQIWHPNQTCDAARAQRLNLNSEILIATASGGNGSNGTTTGDGIIVVDGIVTSRHNTRDSDIKNCPHCKVLIIKMDDGSCNHMTCSVCGTEFCWLCMKQITDLHYLSPSGCTFWGKKPWSRKKKIMWQLGMLVGAPVGIALLAGIAVPAIIIGIPVWVGRKLHARFQKREAMSQKNKHLMLATGVIASVCVSPILALVAVGIGIPILLAYVYGVVPISLCRSGGCNVNTSGSGVRIDMNEESEEISVEPNSTRGAPDGLSVDTALSNKVNPSIGEVSLGMSASLSMGSGSHLDRVTVDRESVSNVPLAGSIYSATPSNKLEVQVDVSSNKRFSFSSHSESASCGISLSERVSNSGALDDGTSSTRGLAGSITGRMVAHNDSLDREVTKGSKDIITSGNCQQHEVVSLTEVQIDPPYFDSACKSISRQISRQDTVITIDSIGSCTSPFGRCVTFQPNLPQTNTTSSTTPTPSTSNATTNSNQFCNNSENSNNRSPSSSSSSPSSSIASTSKSNLAPSQFTQEALSSNSDFNCLTNVTTTTPTTTTPSTLTSTSTSAFASTAGTTTTTTINTSNSNCNSNSSTTSSNHASIYGVKSRSLEQLISYCEVCNSSHRPCCPNYASKRVPVFEDVTKELFVVGKSTASCNSGTINNNSSVKEITNELTSAASTSASSSKVSTKLTPSKKMSSSNSGEKRSNLKRVKSSDSSGVARKSNAAASGICKGNISVTTASNASPVVDGINDSSTCNWSTPNSPVEESLASQQLMMQQEQLTRSSSSITDTFDPATATTVTTTAAANSSNSTASSTGSSTFTATTASGCTILSSSKDGDGRY